jgi:hypothetical protein
MKRTMASVLGSVAFVALVVWATTTKKNVRSLPVVHADGLSGCSTERAAGRWGFTDSGTVVGIGPRTAVGVFALDGNGNLLNGVATSSLNGSVAEETFSGTYTVNPNCTGTLSVGIYVSGSLSYTVTLNLAFDDDMKALRGLFTSAVVEPSGTPLSTVIALDARKQ